MDVIARIDQARRECDVLEHPFYQRWSAGELSAEELGFYAGEYRHAVVALAQASDSVAAKADADHRAGLERHAAEEHSHVALWDKFATAAATATAAGRAPALDDGPQSARASGSEPLPETSRCTQAWTVGEDALEHLAVLYAIEASQPAIAKTKLDGLVERYGYSPEGPAVEYFELHAKLDVEHARQARELISELMSEDEAQARAQAERMIERATAALRGNWELLDGVDARFAHAG
ncbi:MAG TPA: iron-containing redox enzyme family protein [Solirubrobacteraceae bacterium]|jgi:pyrroloquinoline-quinone synthase|nr:iron-containing redox enzyme family protein [Solirubrobacteraceae bacterium]